MKTRIMEDVISQITEMFVPGLGSLYRRILIQSTARRTEFHEAVVEAIRENMLKGPPHERWRAENAFLSDEALALYEEVMRKVNEDTERKKVPLYATLLAHMPWSTRSADDSFSLVSMMRRLSFRQLCVLNMAFHLSSAITLYPGAKTRGLRKRLHVLPSERRTKGEGYSDPELFVLTDCVQMVGMGILRQEKELILDRADIVPSALRPDGVGFYLTTGADLVRGIKYGDMEQVVSMFIRRSASRKEKPE